jgi:ABC-2 type transport system ATP-binding protein
VNHGKVVADAAPAELGARGGDEAVVRWVEHGTAVERRTTTPTALILEARERLGGELEGLEVRRPTLEDVYLALIDEPGA